MSEITAAMAVAIEAGKEAYNKEAWPRSAPFVREAVTAYLRHPDVRAAICDAISMDVGYGVNPNILDAITPGAEWKP